MTCGGWEQVAVKPADGRDARRPILPTDGFPGRTNVFALTSPNSAAVL
jgi:hypothetical protein